MICALRHLLTVIMSTLISELACMTLGCIHPIHRDSSECMFQLAIVSAMALSHKSHGTLRVELVDPVLTTELDTENYRS